MKINDRIVCVNNIIIDTKGSSYTYSDLTIGKIYTINDLRFLTVSGKLYKLFIINDDGFYKFYRPDLFMLTQEYREQQLNKLLDGYR